MINEKCPLCKKDPDLAFGDKGFWFECECGRTKEWTGSEDVLPPELFREWATRVKLANAGVGHLCLVCHKRVFRVEEWQPGEDHWVRCDCSHGDGPTVKQALAAWVASNMQAYERYDELLSQLYDAGPVLWEDDPKSVYLPGWKG